MTAQQLKNSILQMAVQGKLVPQDPTDEPASVLLERIRAEKARLVKEKKIKAEKNPSVIFRGADNLPYERRGNGEPVCIADEVPFEIPSSWEWVRLIDLCEYIQRGKSPKYSPIQKYPVVAQKCNQWSGFSIDKAQFIEPESLSSYAEERILQDDDLMWNSTGLGTLGRMAIYRKELNPYELAVADSHVTVIRHLKQFVLTDYLYSYFSNPSVQSVIEEQSDGSTKQKELSTSTIKAYFVPLPPVDEQYRIVRKISEVLPHIADYDHAEQENSALQSEFPEKLKKSILQYAIQGKLVPQDPTDEPASVLLERIRAEKEALIKAGKIKRDKHESVIYRRDNSHYEKLDGIEHCIDDEIPFEVPDSWCWSRLGQQIVLVSGQDFSPDKYNSETIGTPYLTGASNIDNESVVLNRWTDCPQCIAFCGDLLIVCKGAGVGKMAFLNVPRAHIARQLMAIRCTSSCSVSFLYYCIQYSLDDIRRNMQGVIPGISRDVLLDLLIPVPPITEQHRIVTKIEEILPELKSL